MPFIKTSVNIELSENNKISLKEKLGQAIALIPGKSESWLMLAFEDKLSMSFRGATDEKYAFISVSIFGNTSDAAYDRLTQAISEIINEELDIDRDKIYIKYEEVDHWGWNGSNF